MSDEQRRRWEPPLDPSSWTGALIIMLVVAASAWVVQLVNASRHYSLNRFGLRPRTIDGLWGIVTAPFLHQSYGDLIQDTLPFVAIGWVLLLSGLRVWATVSALVLVLGGVMAWVASPNGHPHAGRPAVIVGSSVVVFGWMGYLLARAYFSRNVRWIIVAVLVLFFFGTLLGNVLPSYNANVPWEAHLCGFVAGLLVGAVLHPRRAGRTRRRGDAAVS